MKLFLSDRFLSGFVHGGIFLLKTPLKIYNSSMQKPEAADDDISLFHFRDQNHLFSNTRQA